MWYDGYQTVSDNRFFQSFRDYVLIPYVDDRPNNLDSLEDEVFDEQDDLLQENGHTYTKEIEEYLKSKSKMTLDKLKGMPLKEVAENIPLGKLKDMVQLNDLPDDYKVKDVNDTTRTEKLITPFEEKDALEKEYTVSDLGSRIKDLIKSKEDMEKFVTYDEKSPENKVVINFELPSETPEEKNGKISWYESLGIEIALHKPKKPSTGLTPTSSIISISDELKGVLALRPKQGENTTDFKNALLDELFDNRNDFERIILSNMPEKILDETTLYDFTMELTMLLRPIPEDKLYVKDMRRTLEDRRPSGRNEEGEMEYITDKKDNPNYGQFELDENGEKVPRFEGDDVDNLVEIKTKFRAIRTAILKPRITMAATTGETERIRGLGSKGRTAGRAGAYTSDKINDARGYYLKQIKARLQKLEEAISDIPIAKEE